VGNFFSASAAAPRAARLRPRRSVTRAGAAIAALAGPSEQSRLSRHFRRTVGVTPGRSRAPARTA
jgi:AraC-like DNA-binding protein